MWAQLIKNRVKPGQEDEVQRVPQEIEAHQQDWGPGLRRVTMLQNQRDPGEYYTLLLFESEEAARENERRPEMAAWQQRMQELYAGPPEFVDLTVVYDGAR